MTAQRRLITLLAGSIMDGVWLPETWSGKLVRRQAGSGLVGTRKVPCPGCGRGDVKGSGWVTDQYRRRSPCGSCGGGFVDGRAVAGQGFVMVDPMDREHRPVGSEETPDAPAVVVTRRCDSCWGEGAHGNGRRCVHCGGSGVRSWSPFRLRLDDGLGGDAESALLAQIDRRRLGGDYVLLERVLASLRGVDPIGWRTWIRCYVGCIEDLYDEEPKASDRERAWCFIESRMPLVPRVPPEVRESEKERRRQLERVRGRWADGKARGARNAEIRRRFERGEASVEELVRVFGVSRSTVYEAIHAGNGG